MSEVNLNELTVAKVWEFPSSSGSAVYQTKQYTNGFVSCNCKGWTMKKGDNPRQCKHTHMVDMGTADQHSTGRKDYTSNAVPKKTNAQPNLSSTPKKKEDGMTTLPSRRILFRN
jgi:hypothetical protein